MSTATERISWFPVPDEADLPPDLQGLFSAARERIGFVPNVFRAYALRPERLSAWFTHFRSVTEGTPGLSGAEREIIAVVVSMANGCLYCLVAHGAALRETWGDPVMADRITLDWRRADGLTERQRAICPGREADAEPARVRGERPRRATRPRPLRRGRLGRSRGGGDVQLHKSDGARHRPASQPRIPRARALRRHHRRWARCAS
jgi:uncharacterized peroxidase-related enzyme